MELSVIIPVHNEKENIPVLADRLLAALKDREFEAIFVDDGSTDGSEQVLREAAAKFAPRFRAIFLRKNFGQTSALSAGIDHARGQVIVLMDGDLENDSNDIPKLLQKLNEGYDVVSGWRVERWKNDFFTRKIPSLLANSLISKVAGLKLHDYGCTLKAYRAVVLKNLKLYGDMHRFLAAYAYWSGAKVAEIPVAYTPRVYGRSHYGLARIGRVLLDLITLKFLSGYATRPLHLFGATGIASIVLGLVSGGFAVYFKFSQAHQKDFIQTPLPVLMVMLVVVGVLLILMGLLGEILVRTYHESVGKTTYTIKEKINF